MGTDPTLPGLNREKVTWRIPMETLLEVKKRYSDLEEY